jgi:cytochrome bd-type quinol oxidase subunit 1
MNLANILCAFLVGFGMMGVVWFFVNVYKARVNQVNAYKKLIMWIVAVLGLITIAGGWYIYSSFGRLPVGGLALGFVLGIRVILNETSGNPRK